MGICKRCGADKESYLEAMGEPCCQEPDSPQYITKVLRQLFRADELATLELEAVIKGRG